MAYLPVVSKEVSVEHLEIVWCNAKNRLQDKYLWKNCCMNISKIWLLISCISAVVLGSV